jgi:hypothetical protein
MVRPFGLDALVVAAAVLNVEWMELELLGQIVELRIVGTIKGVPGHETSSRLMRDHSQTFLL